MTTYIPLRKRNKIVGLFTKFCYDFPCPMNLNYAWNFGSLLGVMMVFQLLTGFFLSLHYVPVSSMAFGRLAYIERDVNWGWFIRSMHQAGASGLMAGMYFHMARGLYYDSYDRTPMVWFSGAFLYVLCMAISFLGYVLPWGQMSYWGATVIINLFSVIPWIGNDIVRLAWGGYSVGDATLNRFYSFHFILPFLMMFLVILHLSLLHDFGSSNPLGVDSRTMMVPFYPYYFYSDYLGIVLGAGVLSYLCFVDPYLIADPMNYEEANFLVTPLHIKPEWYFLPYYALLRSVPNKTGGIVVMVLVIVDFVFIPLYSDKVMLGVQNYMGRSILFWCQVYFWVLLTWLGAQPAEEPFIMVTILVGFFEVLFADVEQLICDFYCWHEQSYGDPIVSSFEELFPEPEVEW